ncbi:hypothetical protein F5148DRAFT_1171988 [Russula earlei]|uniref:Uncharacterized protein n=1 Tax=Russula earlei TaxID=71964 RepID=A0ACC0UIP0_9AGAM|nr:hypothetical protein F5148DRAFT_1171988 [Russula earlei]
MLSSLLVLAIAALAPLAQATVYVTNPVGSSSLPAGQPVSINWKDDGNSPTLAAFGLATVGLYAGNQQQQTLLQLISTVDVSKVSSLNWTPDATVGPNYNAYFLRFTSSNLTDPANPQYRAEAFSAKFTLTGMSGQFNATVQAEISGVGTASMGPVSTAAPASSGSAAPSITSARPAASSGPASSSTNKSNGAGHMVVPRVLGATGVAAVAFAFFL